MIKYRKYIPLNLTDGAHADWLCTFKMSLNLLQSVGGFSTAILSITTSATWWTERRWHIFAHVCTVLYFCKVCNIGISAKNFGIRKLHTVDFYQLPYLRHLPQNILPLQNETSAWSLQYSCCFYWHITRDLLSFSHLKCFVRRQDFRASTFQCIS